MELILIDNNILYNYQITSNKTKMETFKNILIGCSEVSIDNFYDDNTHPDADLRLSSIQSCDSYANVVYNKNNNGFKAEITTYPVLYHVLFDRYKTYNNPFISLYLWLTNTVGIKENKNDLLYNAYLGYLKATKNEDKYAYDKHIPEQKKIWLCRKLIEALDFKLIKAISMDEVRTCINSIKNTVDCLPSAFKGDTFLNGLEKTLIDANENGKIFHEIATRVNIFIDEKGNVLIGDAKDNLLLEKK